MKYHTPQIIFNLCFEPLESEVSAPWLSIQKDTKNQKAIKSFCFANLLTTFSLFPFLGQGPQYSCLRTITLVPTVNTQMLFSSMEFTSAVLSLLHCSQTTILSWCHSVQHAVTHHPAMKSHSCSTCSTLVPHVD